MVHLSRPIQAIYYIRRHICLVEFLHGASHWSTIYLVAGEQEIVRLAEEGSLYDVPLRKPGQ